MPTQNDIAEVAALVRAAVERADGYDLDPEIIKALDDVLGTLQTTPQTTLQDIARLDDDLEIHNTAACEAFLARYPDTRPQTFAHIVACIRQFVDSAIHITGSPDFDDPFEYSMHVFFDMGDYSEQTWQTWLAIRDCIVDQVVMHISVRPKWDG